MKFSLVPHELPWASHCPMHLVTSVMGEASVNQNPCSILSLFIEGRIKK